MKKLSLDQEEKKILSDYDKGKFKRVRNFVKEKARLEKIARFTLKKSKNINIRLSERDLQKVKSRAAEVGIPYQTMVAAVIHQYVNGQIKAQM